MTTILNSKEVEFALLDWKVETNAGSLVLRVGWALLNRPKTLLVKYFVPKKFGLSAKRVALENGIIL